MKVALYSRQIKKDFIEDIDFLIKKLQALNIEPVLFHDLFNQIYASLKIEGSYSTFDANIGLDKNVACVLSLGGDGTLLDTVTLVRDKGIPVVGINYGRLGFLASLDKEDNEAILQAIANHSFQIEERTLVHVDSNIPIFDNLCYGLNEFSIVKKDTSSMITINAFLNGEFLNSYFADGLIVSTATGSTGYSLSAGGPVVLPESKSFVITPVSPHNLNIRPIIVPDTSIISFEVDGRSDEFLITLDSRRAYVAKDVQLAVRKEEFSFKLMRINENSFLNTLRKKLGWGIDGRFK